MGVGSVQGSRNKAASFTKIGNNPKIIFDFPTALYIFDLALQMMSIGAFANADQGIAALRLKLPFDTVKDETAITPEDTE